MEGGGDVGAVSGVVADAAGVDTCGVLNVNASI